MEDGLTAALVDFLNELHQTDPEGLDRLIKARVECNQDMANHPTVQVGLGTEFGQPAEYVFGLMGFINGLREKYEPESPPVAAMYNGDTLVGFRLLSTVTGESLSQIIGKLDE